MKQGYVIDLINCQNCKQANLLTQDDLQYCDSIEAVKMAARKIHKSSLLVCANPKLIIVFSNALIANDLMPEKGVDSRSEIIQ